MIDVDLSEYQDPVTTPYRNFRRAIIRASHGTTEDKHWRQHVWNCGVVGTDIGFYHALESEQVEAEAHYFRSLITPFTWRCGTWVDMARGDLNAALIATETVDRWRAVSDDGLYANKAALDVMPEYKRFERLWYAWISDTPPPGRWLVWQKGKAFGVDVDIFANLGTGVRPGWEAFTWPNS